MSTFHQLRDTLLKDNTTGDIKAATMRDMLSSTVPHYLSFGIGKFSASLVSGTIKVGKAAVDSAEHFNVHAAGFRWLAGDYLVEYYGEEAMPAARVQIGCTIFTGTPSKVRLMAESSGGQARILIADNKLIPASNRHEGFSYGVRAIQPGDKIYIEVDNSVALTGAALDNVGCTIFGSTADRPDTDINIQS